jgi:hypothetical protein
VGEEGKGYARGAVEWERGGWRVQRFCGTGRSAPRIYLT